MSNLESNSDKIRKRLESGFLAKLTVSAAISTGRAQEDYAEQLATRATTFREWIESEFKIFNCDESASEFWKSMSGRKSAFIDGGVANIDLPGAAPLGIRVGAYVVIPGESGEDREDFSFKTVLVDDLYSDSQTIYDEMFEDVDKLRDAARIIAEAAALRRAVLEDESIQFAFIHGPLINPVSPYGLTGFPDFKLSTIKSMIGEVNSEELLSFVPLYKKILDDLLNSGRSVVGVVERSRGAAPGILTSVVLQALMEKGVLSRRARDEFAKDLEIYRISDVVLFGAVLNEREFFGLPGISKQGSPRKWPDAWQDLIKNYPLCSLGYSKPADHQEPIRFECFEGNSSIKEIGSYVTFMSRLLPQYAFPVGLDIVDKYAKVPSWMSGQVRTDQAIALLKKAIRTGDKKSVELAKRILVTKGRDWLFRPKRGK